MAQLRSCIVGMKEQFVNVADYQWWMQWLENPDEVWKSMAITFEWPLLTLQRQHMHAPIEEAIEEAANAENAEGPVLAKVREKELSQKVIVHRNRTPKFAVQNQVRNALGQYAVYKSKPKATDWRVGKMMAMAGSGKVRVRRYKGGLHTVWKQMSPKEEGSTDVVAAACVVTIFRTFTPKNHLKQEVKTQIQKLFMKAKTKK